MLGLSCWMQDLQSSLQHAGSCSCSIWNLVLQLGIEPVGPPALGAGSLSHWTTREVPKIAILKGTIQWHLVSKHSQCCTIISGIYFQNIFVSLKGDTIPISSHFPFPTPRPWQPWICFLSLWIYLLWISHMNRIIQYMGFCVLLLSLSMMFLRFIHDVACVRASFLFVTEWYNIV